LQAKSKRDAAGEVVDGVFKVPVSVHVQYLTFTGRGDQQQCNI
jgi:hypothetical protein